MNKEQRKQAIVGLIEKRWTYAAIGEMLGISRQRVHQIYVGYQSPANSIRKTNRKIGIVKHGLEGKDFLRERIRVRDNYTCQICGKKWKEGMRRFDVHHLNLIPSQTMAMYYKYNKNPKVLITLCHKCHLNIEEHKRAMVERKHKWKSRIK